MKEKQEALDKKNIIWNILGSFIYAITSMVLGIVVTRIVGDVEGGIFFFAFSTLGQQLYIIAYFGMRPIQVTDTMRKYQFIEYIQFRTLTCAFAMILGFIYALFFAKTVYILAVWISLILYKVIDGFADCIESELQRLGRLYLTGQSIAGRTVFSITVFLMVLVWKRNLLLASGFAVLGLSFGIFLFGVMPLQRLQKNLGIYQEKIKIDIVNNISSYKALFSESKWLFISSFLDLYIFSATKYAVNTYLGESASAYFSIIFIPTSVINLMAGFVIRPVLTKLSLDYTQKKKKAFQKTVWIIVGLILIFTIVGMLAAGFLGIPVLSILLGTEMGSKLAPYTKALILIILGGGFYAILNLMYYCLVILEKKTIIFLIYLIGTILAYGMSNQLVLQYQIYGAAYGYVGVMLIMMLMFIASYWYSSKKQLGNKKIR